MPEVTNDQMAQSPRAILHADLDCFYAAVEILDHPTLQGRPVIVCGTGRRGVVAAANYEARVFGVRSAMATSQARQRCPDGVFIDGRHSRYSELSRAFMAILSEYTPMIESVSLDEAFLDVTGARRRLGEAEVIAQRLRRQVLGELGLVVSIGVGTTKQVAKLASRFAKPRVVQGAVVKGSGIYVVPPGGERRFMGPLRVEELWGVGPAMSKRLHSLGVRSVYDLWEVPPEIVRATLGEGGRSLLETTLGRTVDRVTPAREMKTMSQEETYAYDLYDADEIHHGLARLSDALSFRLLESKLTARTLEIKVRDIEFQTTTRSKTFERGLSGYRDILNAATHLLDTNLTRNGVRLLGISASKLAEDRSEQLALDMVLQNDTDYPLNEVITQIKARYGESSLAPASLLRQGEVRARHRRSSQWGPTDPQNDTSSYGEPFQ